MDCCFNCHASLVSCMTCPGIAQGTGILRRLIALHCDHSYQVYSALIIRSWCLELFLPRKPTVSVLKKKKNTSFGQPTSLIGTVTHLQVLDNGSTCREMLTWLSTWEAQDAISANGNPSSCYHREESHERDQDQDWVQNVRICCHVQLVLWKHCCWSV